MLVNIAPVIDWWKANWQSGLEFREPQFVRHYNGLKRSHCCHVMGAA